MTLKVHYNAGGKSETLEAGAVQEGDHGLYLFETRKGNISQGYVPYKNLMFVEGTEE